MINKIKITLLLSTIILLLTNVQSVFADEYEDFINNYINPTAEYTKGIDPPYCISDDNEENIDLITGNLQIKSTDLNLKGRNGLDLELTRYYSLNNSLIYEPDVEIVHGWIESDGYTSEYFDTEIVPTDTIYEERYDLGAGWAFDFPFIERKGDYKYLHYGSAGVWRIVNNSLDDYLLDDVTIETSSEFCVDDLTSQYVLIEKDGKKYYFSSDGYLLGIEDRFNNSIKFYYDGNKICKIVDTVGREVIINYVSSTQVEVSVTDETDESNNITIYYNKTKFFNETTNYEDDYIFAKYKLTSVIDSEGRETLYDYNVKKAYYSYCLKRAGEEYTFEIPDGGTTYIYYSPRDFNYDNYYVCLEGITHPTGAKTVYDYGQYTRNFGNSGSTQFYKVKERYDDIGYVENDADDYDDILLFNYKYYNYDIDGARQYDGWDWTDPVSLYHTIETTVRNDIDEDDCTWKEEHTYGQDFLCNQILYEGDNHKQKSSFEYDDNNETLKKKITKIYDISTEEYIKKVEDFEYDDYRDLITYWDEQAERDSSDEVVVSNEEHKISCTYDSNYHFLTNKIYKQDSNTTIEEEYTVTDNGKAIRFEDIYKNDVLQKRTKYNYDFENSNTDDDYGNILEIQEYVQNDNGTWEEYISTHFCYDDNNTSRNGQFDGAYPTRKWAEDIKDADNSLIAARSGNDPGIIDEIYQYDWFGNMTSSQDGEGNISSYEYDTLGRVEKIINSDNSYKQYNYTTNETENSVLITDENENQIKNLYDEFGNIVAQQDLTSGEYINRWAYDLENHLTGEYNYDKSSINYSYLSDLRLQNKEVNEEFTWFSNYLPYGSTKDYWDWKCEATTDYGEKNKYFENAQVKMKIDEGDYIFVELYIERPDAIMFHWKENGSWEHRAYWGNIDNFDDPIGEENTVSQRNMGAIPFTNDTGFLVVPASLVGLENKEIDGMMVSTIGDNDYVITHKVGLYRGTNMENTLYNETYDYLDSDTNNEYSIITKTVTGEETAPSIVTKNYINNVGQVEKVEKIHMENSIDCTYVDTYEYDYIGNIIKKKNAKTYEEYPSEEYSIKYDYDFEGKVVKVYNINDQYISNEYNSIGRLICTTDYKGNTTTYNYDNLGRLISEEIPFEEINNNEYNTIKKYYFDRNGNTTKEKVLSNLPEQTENYKKVEYEYDNRDRLIKVVTYDDEVPENYTQYYYDDVGNIRRMYTGLNSPLTINGLDNIIPSSDNEYSCTKYDNYDTFRRVGQITDSLDNSESFTYDLSGNIISKTDRNGNIATNIYDGLNRMIGESIVTPNNDGDVENTYEYYLNGQLQNVNNGEISYEYDDLGRLIKETETSGITKEYTYDANNNILTFLLKQDSTIKQNLSYVYDELDRLYQVLDNGVVIATYGYDDNGNRESLEYSNGNNTSYTYNNANLLKSLTNQNGTTQISKYEYTYYLDGNRESEIKDTADTTYYQYDGLNRLTNVTLPDTSVILYDFDDYNNRETMTKGLETTSYMYDENNRLLKETNTLGDVTTITSYNYDNNGNQLNKAKEIISLQSGQYENHKIAVLGVDNQEYYETYEYDGLNRLITARIEDKTINYTYNSNNLRKTKEVNGIVTKHIWNGQNIVAEADGSNNITANYIRGINLIKSIEGTTDAYHIYNGHGDVIQLTNSTGNVTKNYNYDAFGNEENIDENDTNPFRYCGEYYDKETGTYYLRARYYNPNLGRFISEDPYWKNSNPIYGNDPLELSGYTINLIEVTTIDILKRQHAEKNNTDIRNIQLVSIDAISQSSNLYSYCMNNPILYIDPSGLKVYIAGGEGYAQCGLRVNFSKAIIWDDNGNVGILDSESIGAGWLALGAGGFYSVIDTENIEDVQGASFELGGGATIGVVSGGVDYTVSLGDVKYDGWVYNIGGSVGLPFDAHAQLTYTHVNDDHPLTWLIEGMIKIYKIYEEIKQ